MPIRYWMAIISIGMIVAVLLSGCLGQRETTDSLTSPPVIMVDYQRTGGLAGVDDRVVIFDNGVTLVSTRKGITEIALNKTDLEQIDSILTTSRFMELEGNYTSARGGADFLRYSISYHGKTVNTEDTAIPAHLQPVIDEMNRIAEMGLGSEKANSPLPLITP